MYKLVTSPLACRRGQVRSEKSLKTNKHIIKVSLKNKQMQVLGRFNNILGESIFNLPKITALKNYPPPPKKNNNIKKKFQLKMSGGRLPTLNPNCPLRLLGGVASNKLYIIKLNKRL